MQAAGLRKRLHAFVYDGMILVFFLAAPIGIGAALRWTFGPPRWSQRGEEAFAFLVLILPVILYFAWAESSPRQATFGKRRAGLVVVTATGARLSFRRALLRSALKFLPWQLAHSCLFSIPGWPANPEQPMPIIWAGLILSQALVLLTLGTLTFGRHRTPYDLIAGTRVVAAPRPSGARERHTGR